MAIPTYISDYEERALRRTLARHRTKRRLCALFKSFGFPAQLLEDALLGVSSDSLFDNATGVMLNRYGAILGEPRGGFDDPTYRRLILARGLANQSQGTADEMIEILKVLAPVDATVEHQNIYPASCLFTVISKDPPAAQYLERVGIIMRAAKPAGVSFGGVWAVIVPFGFVDRPDVNGYDLGQFAFSF